MEVLQDPPDATPLLSIRHLSLSSPTTRVLDDINMTLYAGERVAILGSSGTGKSLLAKALTGILPRNIRCSGEISFCGYDIAGRHPAMRAAMARVSMVDQDTTFALSPLHTLGQQLMMVCAGAGHSRRSQRWRAKSSLEQVGLPAGLMRRYPAELSGGQRQRACIALVLACDTPLLVADEPTTALDAASQQRVLQALEGGGKSMSKPDTIEEIVPSEAGKDALPPHSLLQNKALLLITHDVRAAMMLCNRALVLHKGRIVEDVKMAQLLSAPQHAFSQRMIRALENEQRRLRCREADDAMFCRFEVS